MRLIQLALICAAVALGLHRDDAVRDDAVRDDVDDTFTPVEEEEEGNALDRTVLDDPSEDLDKGLDDVKPQASYDFQAETDRLMDIIVHSLYTERDVFLRELISNSADALEKVRITNLLEKKVEEEEEDELRIMVKINKEKNEISIIDNGIGMSRDELEKNLGTVARSGTNQFMEAAKRGDSASNLIGQFGVGFYSAFLVADKVTVISKRADNEDRYIWQSRAKGGFSISKDTRDISTFDHGTIVTLHLKDDAKKLYTDKYKIKYILQRFSAFVPFPIFLGETRGSKAIQWQRTNGNKPLWLRDRSEISDEEYIDFYRNFTKVSAAPMSWTHFKAEGDYEFNGLFYLPVKVPNMPPSASSAIKLYVQRVLITDSLDDFLPRYLSFIKGVVDSNDLPLKVDRENFSQMKVMRVMKKKAFAKVFEMFNKLAKEARVEKDDVEQEVSRIRKQEADALAPKSLQEIIHTLDSNRFSRYTTFVNFWQSYGDQIMTGCVEPDVSRKEKEKILSLYHAHTTYGNKLLTSLEDYISRMLPGQRTIYIMTGDNIELMMKSPYIEFFNKHGVEVLLITGPYDEQCLMQMLTWKKYDIISIEMDQMLKIQDLAFAIINSNRDSSSSDSSFDSEDETTWKQKVTEVVDDYRVRQFGYNKMYKPLLDWINKRLSKHFNGEIKISLTLPVSPARISIPHNGFTASHERLARTTINLDKHMIDEMAKNKHFELNPNHPLIHHLLQEVTYLKEHKNEVERERKVNHMIDMIYESALIACGFLSRKPYLLLEDFYRLVQIEQNLSSEKIVEIPQEILEQAKWKVLGKEEEIDDDEYFNEKDEL